MPQAKTGAQPRKFIVTTAPPTPNGDLHLGHISGPYMASDVFARCQRLAGNDVLYVSYSDVYQNYVERKAIQLGSDAEKVSAGFTRKIAESMEKAQIAPDIFLSEFPNRHFTEAAARFHANLSERGLITRKSTPVKYSAKYRQFGYEGFARGRCVHCGEPADPCQCEFCGMPMTLETLADVKCPIDQEELETTRSECDFMDVAHFFPVIRKNHRGKGIRKDLRNFLTTVMADNRLTWQVSRHAGYGVPKPGGEGEILHTWFNGISGYLAASKQHCEDIGDPGRFSEFWESESTIMVNFLGFDCSFSHAIVYVALLSTLENAPMHVHTLTNRFLNLDGKCFSTSRNYAIFVSPFLETVDAALVRLYLCLNSPERDEKNFVLADFHEFCNTRYVPKMNAALRKACLEPQAPPAHATRSLLGLAKSRWETAAALEGFSVVELAASLMALVNGMDEAGPGQAIYLVKAYALLAGPIQPAYSGRLKSALGMDTAADLGDFETAVYGSAAPGGAPRDPAAALLAGFTWESVERFAVHG